MNKKVPEIRFKEFVDEWTNTPLKEVSIKVTDKNMSKDIKIVLTNSAELGVIDQREYFDRNIANDNSISGYYVVCPNDYVYNPRISTTAPVGPINRNKLEYIGVMSPLYYVFRIKGSDIDLQYLDYFFKSSIWHDFMYKNGNSGARSDRFSINDTTFSLLPISHPISTLEQAKIGNLLTTIDKLIDKLEQKLEKLRNIKQALLNQMFINVNRGGYEAPLLRFTGYNEPWNMKQLNEYLSVSDEKNQDEQFDKYSIFSVSRKYGIVNQIAYQGKSFAGESLKNYRVVRNANVVYTKSPLKEQPYGIIKSNLNEDGIVSALYAVYKTTINVVSEFVGTYFESDSRLNEYLRCLVNKGAKNTLLVSDEDALHGIVAFPKEQEQARLTNLFLALGSVIDKHETKLTKLRNTKQSLLHKMFV